MSSASTTSSVARIRALAEAAAARESAEYERIIAAKDARKEREAELERNRKQERAQHDKDLAMLAASRKVAVAKAKVRAIEIAMEEQEIEERDEISGVPHIKIEERTLD